MAGDVRVGFRVVRGPDWQWRGQDGGEGHVGTVVELGRDSSSSSPAKTAVVQWDSGSRTNYRCGYGGKHDLRLLDNSPVGTVHKGIICDECRSNDYEGIRWKCTRCDNYDLCHSCYRRDKHDLGHRFWRIDNPGSMRVEVPPRADSIKIIARGIFPGARVVRGADWQWSDQDGGAGNVGVVNSVLGWNNESKASVAQVKWANGGTNVYRLGHQGKVDLKFVEAATTDPYYRDHLPVLSFDAPVSTGCGSIESGDVVVGDLVRISLDIELWQQLQESSGHWTMEMMQCIGEVGEVNSISDTGALVNFARLRKEWLIHPAALTKVTRLKKGDYVRMIDDIDEIKMLMDGHGGWVSQMQQFVTKVGRVVAILPNLDIRVSYGPLNWIFHPGCMRKVVDSPGDDVPPEQSGQSEEVDLEQLLQRFLLGREPGIMLAKAVQEGDVAEVRQVCTAHPEHVNDHVGDKKHTPIQIAAHLGMVEIMKILKEAGADLAKEDEDGDSALHYAVHGEEHVSVECLIELGMDVNICNHKAETALHIAVNRGHEPCVRSLLASGASLAMQDAVGDTPLLDAIARDHDEIVEILLDKGADMTVANYRGFSAMHQAALRGGPYVMEKLVAHAPHLINLPKEDGFTPLHLAAFNNHVGVATVLLRQENCEIDARNCDGRTPLILAISRGFTGTIELLISFGADLDAADEQGDGPLHHAMLRSSMAEFVHNPSGLSDASSPVLDEIKSKMRLEGESLKTAAAIACFLAQEGCSLTACNHQGKTPIDLCVSSEVKALVHQFAKPKGWSSFHGSNRPGSTSATASATASDGGNQPSANISIPEGMTRVEESSLPDDCLLCDNKANMRCLPCGHQVVCVSCGEKSKRCGFRSCKVEVKMRQMVVLAVVECFLCSEPAVVEFKPCGHVVTCRSCSATPRKCPKCQEAVEEKLFEGKPLKSPTATVSTTDELDVDDPLACPICLESRKEVAFFCGHQTCMACSRKVFECPICRKAITHRITLF